MDMKVGSSKRSALSQSSGHQQSARYLCHTIITIKQRSHQERFRSVNGLYTKECLFHAPHTKVLPDGKFGQINWKKTASMQRMQIMIFYLKLYTNAQRINWCPRQGQVMGKGKIDQVKSGQLSNICYWAFGTVYGLAWLGLS